MMKKLYLIFTSIILLGFTPALADELAEASKGACEMMKRCVLADIKSDDSYPPEMKAMMEQQMQQSCTSMVSGYGGMTSQHPMYGPATACMQSMADQSCEDFNNGAVTPACTEFEKRGAAYGR